MPKRTQLPETVKSDEGWSRSTTYVHNGRSIEPGTELSITGQPGARFKFVEHVVSPQSEWITVVGGTKGYSNTRSFRPGLIKTVHRIGKMK